MPDRECRHAVLDDVHKSIGPTGGGVVDGVDPAIDVLAVVREFIAASLDQCDYTQPPERAGEDYDPDDYLGALANIREMHRLLDLRADRLLGAGVRMRTMQARIRELEDQLAGHGRPAAPLDAAGSGQPTGDTMTHPGDVPAVAALLGPHFPVDGPFDGPHTGAAALGVRDLVGYLIAATGQGSAEHALPFPSTAHDLTGGLQAAADDLVTLFPQVEARLQRLSNTDPNLFDRQASDRGDDPVACHQAAVRRILVVLHALQEARAHAFGLARFLDAAADNLAQLGVRD
jgi:hypothetical protein